MKQVKYRTYSLPHEDIKRQWHVVDAQGKVLGQISTEIATLLIGKNKLGFTTHTDNGDCVVVINASKVAVTGNKEEGKIYYHHTNFPGGFRQENLAHLRARKPEQIIELAVKNMLPKNRTRRDRMARLKVFSHDQHPFANLVAKKD